MTGLIVFLLLMLFVTAAIGGLASLASPYKPRRRREVPSNPPGGSRPQR